jgi:hypothetical protein
MAAKFKLDESIFRTFLTEVVLRKNYGFKVIDVFDEEEDCSVCSDSMEDDPVLIPPCGHKFHHNCLMECIVEYNMKSCPSCSADGDYDEYKFQQETDFTYPVPDPENKTDEKEGTEMKEVRTEKKKRPLEKVEWDLFDDGDDQIEEINIHENYVDNSLALIPYDGDDDTDDSGNGYDVFGLPNGDPDDSDPDEDVVQYMKGELFDEQEDKDQKYAEEYEHMNF